MSIITSVKNPTPIFNINTHTHTHTHHPVQDPAELYWTICSSTNGWTIDTRYWSYPNRPKWCYLKSLETHKAAGPDEIPAQLLKDSSELLAPSLTLIYQASLYQCSLPTDWKKAYIVPIFKKGNRNTPSNYRPVSLTCICSKITEHIVYSHIFAHLSHHSILRMWPTTWISPIKIMWVPTYPNC